MTKRILAAFLTLIGVLSAVPAFAASQDLTERVAGHILLQVESRGEAWYVNPVLGVRFYMKDGPTAYEMMRTFGLGMTEADYVKLAAGNTTLINRLKGRIVLRVQAHGEAYYIHPDGSVHYLKDGPAAYEIMRSLSLGITNEDLGQVEEGEMPVEVANVLAEVPEPEPVVETIIVAEPVSIEELAREFARELVAEQERVAAEKLWAEEDAQEAAQRAAESAQAEKDWRKAEALRVATAIGEKNRSAYFASPYRSELDAWPDFVWNKVNNVCRDIETQQLLDDCDEAVSQSGVSKSEILAGQLKYGGISQSWRAANVHDQCRHVNNISEDIEPCDAWMRYVRSLFAEHDKVMDLHKKLMEPYRLMSERFSNVFAPTLKDGSLALGNMLTPTVRDLIKTELGSIGITTQLLD